MKSYLFHCSYELESLLGVKIVPSINSNFCLVPKVILIAMLQDLKLVPIRDIETKTIHV